MDIGYLLISWSEPQHAGTEQGGNKYAHTFAVLLSVSNSRIEESPTPLKKSGPNCVSMRDRLCQVGTFRLCTPTQALSLPEKSQESASVAESQTTKALAFGRYPALFGSGTGAG